LNCSKIWGGLFYGYQPEKGVSFVSIEQDFCAEGAAGATLGRRGPIMLSTGRRGYVGIYR
jgi:hypothetical protein